MKPFKIAGQWYDAESITEMSKEIDRLRAALEEIACRHVTTDPLWWQRKAREALDSTKQ